MSESSTDQADVPDDGARSRRVRNLSIAAVVVMAGLVGLVLFATGGSESVRLTSDEVDRAWRQAGCSETDVPDLDGEHIPESDAPPPEELYPVRPPTSGEHFGRPVTPIGPHDEPVLEADAIQSMERGAVVVWYDPSRVDDQTVTQMAEWAERRNEAGFAAGARGGAGVIVAPYPEGLPSGKAVAMHAWHTPVHCETFDVTAADGFLGRHFGTRGPAPEGQIGGYPDDAVTIVGASG